MPTEPSEKTELHPERLAAVVDVLVRDALTRIRSAGHEAWLVGGCVRDLFLGRTPGDFDIATSARPEVIQKLFRRTVPTGIRHGTVTVLLDGTGVDKVEVTTFRGEGAYTDGRRPESVEFIDDLVQDLSRRDFTINAIALDPGSGEVRDPFHGVADIRRRRVRCVGSAAERFAEDGLRPLRAVRFSSVLQFGLDPATHAAIPATLETFRKVARERVRDELTKLLLGSQQPSRGVRLLAETGLLREIIPELLEGQGVHQNRAHRWDVFTHMLHVLDHTPPDLVIRLAALLHDVAKPRCAISTDTGEHVFRDHDLIGATLAQEILERLRFPGKTSESVALLIREHAWHYDPAWTDGAVRRALRRVGVEYLPAFFALREADVQGKGRGLAEGLHSLSALRQRFAAEEQRAPARSLKDLAVSGSDVMTGLGRGPGPWLGRTLEGLLEHVLDHPEDNDRETLLALARQISSAEPP
jgi:tRNA nucleotidyltransferase (CCA-adding enzyme)